MRSLSRATDSEHSVRVLAMVGSMSYSDSSWNQSRGRAGGVGQWGQSLLVHFGRTSSLLPAGGQTLYHLGKTKRPTPTRLPGPPGCCTVILTA